MTCTQCIPLAMPMPTNLSAMAGRRGESKEREGEVRRGGAEKSERAVTNPRIKGSS